jgi:hypothetical protein
LALVESYNAPYHVINGVIYEFGINDFADQRQRLNIYFKSKQNWNKA